MATETWLSGNTSRTSPMPISPTLNPRKDVYVPVQDVERGESIEMDVEQIQAADDDDDELELELDFHDWKLELDDDNTHRPGNPVARQFEERSQRSTYATLNLKDWPASKRYRYASNSFDSMLETSETWRSHTDGTPPERAQHYLRGNGDKRSAFASPPPSPSLLMTRSPRTQTAQHPSSPLPPSSNPPRYYTGGPVTAMELSLGPSQRTFPDSHSKERLSAIVPSRRGGHLGTTPPSVFYAKPPEIPRGGGISPLREVIRKMGIS